MLTNFSDDLGIVACNKFQGTIVLPTAKLRTYHTIRKAILSGMFPPGSHLREEELSELCNTSRTPVRQAIRRLADEGLPLTSEAMLPMSTKPMQRKSSIYWPFWKVIWLALLPHA